MSASYGPYSPIFKAGPLYFVSGQLGVNPKTKKAHVDIVNQTHQAMRNLQDTLETEGLGMKDIAQTTLYLARMDQFAAVNEIYESYFDTKAPKPARECVEVSALPQIADHPLLIEISATAYKASS